MNVQILVGPFIAWPTNSLAHISVCRWSLLLVWGALTFLATPISTLAGAEADAQAVQFFETKIRPVLHEHCVSCHSDAEPESGLSLESYAGLMRGGKLGAAITPGKPKESLLISAVNHDEFLKMPPKSKLSTAQLADLTNWVAMGAPWPEERSTLPGQPASPDSALPSDGPPPPSFTPEQRDFWAYQPLERPALPNLPVAVASQLLSPIDHFIAHKLLEAGLQANPPADRQQLLRRVTYDLTGLAPSADQLAQFQQDDRPDALARIVDRLLASPRYGEKWGRHWLDVARYADSNGLDENIGYPNAFRYRDYVVSSLNNDKPYDRFVQEQIAGDLMPNGSSLDRSPHDRFIATGFLAIGAKMLAEDDPMKMQMDIIDEQLTVLCQAFMGMTIGCARCHDHKYDPITADDYYALAGIFKSSRTMANHKVVAQLFERPLATADQLEQVQQLENQREATAKELSQLNDAVAARVKHEVGQSISRALQATLAYEAFSAAWATQAVVGLNHTDSSGPGYLSQQDQQPYRLDDGYALIEAEGFHRGDVGRDHTEYGKQIGIIGSSGAAHVEYDLEVAQPGLYAIELRYAAVERRPLKLLIDGQEVNARVATETFGSWNPDGQMWIVAGWSRLAAGKHTLRLESRRSFPHIDKLAVVYQTTQDQSWPFGKPPVSLSRSGIDTGMPFPIVALWRNHLNEIQRSTNLDAPDMSFYGVWLRLSGNPAHYATAAADLWPQLEGNTPVAQQTPEPLRRVLLERRPASLAQLADVYAAVIEPILALDEKASPSDVKLREHLLAKSSPLNGLKSDHERYYTVAEEEQAATIRKRLADLDAQRPEVPLAMGVSEDKPEDLKVHLRGSHLVLGKLVSRRMPTILSRQDDPPIDQAGSGRYQLAMWMTRPDHPLTSRVMVNRMWHWHFGRGLVPTVDNFGLLGLPPTHPELLDWLATELVEHDWSLKHMHRLLILSDVYQRSSSGATDNGSADTTRIEHCAANDPENQWLWRFRRRRLTAEETRDSILSVGVGLDLTMYGTHMKTQSHKYVNTSPGGDLDYSPSRRSIYLPVIRSGVLDVLQTLDFPDPAMINGERQTSTVAPQALMMLNSDLVHEQSLIIAEQMLKQSSSIPSQIAAAWQRILKRSPTDSETASAVDFLDRADQQGVETLVAWQSLCRVLIASNEFSYVE